MVDISRAHSDREGVCRFLLFFQLGSDRVTRDAKWRAKGLYGAVWRPSLSTNSHSNGVDCGVVLGRGRGKFRRKGEREAE